LAEQKCHLDKPKSGEQGLVVMAAGHVAKPKRRSSEGPYALTLILRGRWNIKLGVHTHDGGARAKFYREVCEAHLARIVKVDLKSDLFTYDIDERALKHAKMMDGKLLLVTNAPDFTPAEVLKRYKSLADIERGFRVLKSEIEIGPIYHRLPDRIHAHASICFMALIVYRVMRSRLRDSHTKISPERALDKLRRIQHQVVTVNDLEPIAALSSINKEHTEILQALTIKKPTLPAQLTLL